jgi:hypothetical protein
VRTIIAGRVTEETLRAAEMFGIEPTSFVTNGTSLPPASQRETLVIPIDNALGAAGKDARDYTLAQNADALVLKGQDDHLFRIAAQYGLAVYQEA